ncbi:hypothetical protein Tco_1113716 [Tanacetum coccineum]|uniref:Uncharacterized protein n=1 Tax=Tanacetum coccineum TaxID=301880 RepID=A0ABQ5IVY7_9ASTR
MAIPVVMLNDVIKVSAHYSEYLAKSKGSAPVKATSKGKELLSKEGSKEVAEDVDSKEINEEPPVRRRPTRVVIGREVRNESDDEGLDHSKKLKRLETLSEAAQFQLNIKKALKASKDDLYIQHLPQRGSEVPNEPNDYSSSSSSDLEFTVEDISSGEAEVTKKDDEVKKVEAEKDIDDHSKKPESQVDSGELESRVTKLEKKVHAMSSFNLPEAIDKSVKAHLMNVLPKDVPDFGKIKMEKVAKKIMPKYSSIPFDQAALDEFEEKDKLFQMMSKSRSYNKHPAHKALYDAPALSLNAKKKRKRKDSDAPASKKRKDKGEPSKGTKARSRPPPSKKDVDADDQPQDGAIDNSEMAQDADFNTEEHPQGDAAPSQDRSKWFKKPPKLETPNLEWHKHPNADKDKITKADLEGPVFKHLKGTFRSSIELEYHLEQSYLAFYDQLDWINPEGDRCPYDLSKPLPLQGPPGHLTIPVEFFFNNDLEYLNNGNKEMKYDASVTKIKAARYDLKFIEDMILKLWSPTKVAYDKHVVLGIFVRRADLKEYSFREPNFSRLHLNDIEDLFLLYVQRKIHNLTGEEIVHLLNALCMFTRIIVRGCAAWSGKLPKEAQHHQATDTI